MKPGRLDLTFDQNSAYSKALIVRGQDFTGYVGEALVKRDFDDSSPLLTFTTSDETMTIVVTEATQSEPVISTITLSQPQSTLRELTFDKAVWDLVLTPSVDEGFKFLFGNVQLNRTATL